MSKLHEEIKKYSLLPYRLRVVPEVCTDGSIAYVATNPELPGCMSHGDTNEEAIKHLEEARQIYIADLIERDLPVPMPQVSGTTTMYAVESIVWDLVQVEVPSASEQGLMQSSIPQEVPSFVELGA